MLMNAATECALVRSATDASVTLLASPKGDAAKYDAPTLAMFGSLQTMWNYLNDTLFSGRLEGVLLNLSRHNPRTLGFFAPDRWEDGTDKRVSEISLNPSNLKHRTPEQIVSTLAHEMLHCGQHQRPDLYGTPSRSYHNRAFADAAESIGLMTSDTGLPGGRRVGPRMTHCVIEGGAFQRAFQAMPSEWFLPFTCGERTDRTTGKGGKGGDASKKRYQCPGCRTRFWGKSGISAICTPCLVVAKETGAPLESAVYQEAA